MEYKKFVISVALVATSSFGESKLSDTTVLSGDIRAMYYAEDDGTNNENAFGIGLNPSITRDSLLSDKLIWEIGAGAAIPLTESSEGYTAEAGMAQAGTIAYGDDGAKASEGYVTLTQLNGTYDYGGGRVKVGYQLMDTPMPEKDDIRLVPNSYLAGVVDYRGIDTVVLIAGYVAQMAGAVDSSASEDSHAYQSMSDAAVGGMLAEAGLGDNSDVKDRGVSVAAVVYAEEKSGISAQFWRYYMEEPYEGMGDFLAMYADAGAAVGSVTISVQHMRYKNDVWMNTASGLMAEAEWGDFALTGAYNAYSVAVEKQNLANTLGVGDAPVPTWYAWGRYPEFVAGEEVDASMADWDGGSAYMLSGSYGGFQDLSLTLSYLSYSDAVNAVDAVAEVVVSEAASMLFIYESKDFESEDDTATLEIKAFYTF